MKKVDVDNIEFSKNASDDFDVIKLNDKKMAQKIVDLINDIIEEPFSGLGKPEPLKYGLQGYWSRRIDGYNRLVYRISKKTLKIISVRYHYKK